MSQSTPLSANHTDTRVRHTRRGPVFVVGHARSGTSLTCGLLRDFLGVCFGTESQFIIRYHQRLGRYGDLRHPPHLAQLLDDIRQERYFVRTGRNFGFALDVERALRETRDPTYAALLQSIFGQFAAGRGLERWGDKTPVYSRHLPVLVELFPDAQFIHVVRDGRDVALSLFNQAFGPHTVYHAAIEWSRLVKNIRANGASLPPGTFMEFRYEDLVRDPAGTLGRTATFLGITDGAGRCAALESILRERVHTNGTGKWRHGLTRRELECFETLSGPALAMFAYELVSSPRPIRRADVTWWRLQGAWRKCSNPKYWSDNWYRLTLRARDGIRSLRTFARGTTWQPAARGRL